MGVCVGGGGGRARPNAQELINFAEEESMNEATPQDCSVWFGSPLRCFIFFLFFFIFVSYTCYTTRSNERVGDTVTRDTVARQIASGVACHGTGARAATWLGSVPSKRLD